MGDRSELPPPARSTDQGSTAPEALLYRVHVRAIVDSRSAAAVARRAALSMGCGALHAGSVAIAASELATNIARHAGVGLIQIYSGHRYLKIVAHDRGPGLTNVEIVLADRYSGGRQLGSDDPRREGIGCGLGAVRRMMDQLEICSTPGIGTRIVAVKHCPEKRT
jgi:serine/threonine-protein kinase RsbT